MLWTHFTLVATFYGVIFCNRFVDNRLIDFSAPYAAAVRNSDAQKVAFLESLSNVSFMSENLSDPPNEVSVFYQNNHPYHHINKQNSNLEKKDDNAALYFNKIFNEKNESHQENDNVFGSGTDVMPSNQENAALGLNDLSLIAYEKLSDNPNDGQMPHDLDSFLDNDERALLALNADNAANFYEDLLRETKNSEVKRGSSVSTIGCDCKIKNDLLDLGQKHFPRYLLNAVCQSHEVKEPRCWRGICKPLEYKVKVLTFRTVKDQKDPALAWLPDDLRQLWKFKTVTVAAGCFCAVG